MKTSALLQPILLASTVLAATHEQEIEAEAKKLMPTLFSKCGEDHFSKWTEASGKDVTYMIVQYKGLVPIFQLVHLGMYDPRMGVEWKGVVQYTATQGREILYGDGLVKQGIPREKIGVWSPWNNKPKLSMYQHAIVKRKGKIIITQKPQAKIEPLNCKEIPKG